MGRKRKESFFLPRLQEDKMCGWDKSNLPVSARRKSYFWATKKINTLTPRLLAGCISTPGVFNTKPNPTKTNRSAENSRRAAHVDSFHAIV